MILKQTNKLNKQKETMINLNLDQIQSAILFDYFTLKNNMEMLTVKRRNIVVVNECELSFFLPNEIQTKYNVKKFHFNVPADVLASEVYRAEFYLLNSNFYLQVFTSKENTSFKHKQLAKKALEVEQPKVEKKKVILSSTRAMGIDPGINKWMSCVDNVGNSFIISCKTKSEKKVAHAANLLINHCKKQRISHVVLGNAGGWTECNYSIQLKSMLVEKASKENITIEVVKEDFTTQVSFLKKAKFSSSGYKVETGLDKDCNAAANLMRNSKKKFDFSHITEELLTKPALIKL